MRKKVIALLLCAATVLTGIPALGGTKVQAKAKDEVTPAKVSEAQTGEPADDGLSDIFPLKKKLTLTYYMGMNSAMAATMESYNTIEFFKELEKKTNVHIKWNHNTNDNALSLMIAGGDLPDMMNASFGGVAGGIPALLEDKIIVDLTKIIPKCSPNYYDWLKNNPEEDKAFKLDDGTLFQYANFNADWSDKKIKYFNITGPQIRQDWLDKLGLDMPKTTDDLYKVLKAFKDNDMNGNGDKTDEVPYVLTKDINNNLYSLAGAFGTRKDYHMQDGKIVYGPITDNWKNFLTYARKLYKDGLVTSDMGTNSDGLDMVLQDRGGFTISSMGTGVIASHDALKANNPEANYVSCPWLAGPDGDKCSVFDRNSSVKGTVITTKCKHPEIAAAWLDYAYSYAGSLASTFGVEGKSYEFKDGYPTVMDAVKKNDKGWSEEQSLCRWMLGSVNYPNARDFRFYEQMNLNEPYKKDMQENWGDFTEDILMPPLVLNTKETKSFAKIMSDVNTYVDECSMKFIMGDMSIDSDWDSYVKNVKGMGLSDAMKSKEAAYARYQKR